MRGNLRTDDALFVAFALALGATLITLDRRLAVARGPGSPVEVVGGVTVRQPISFSPAPCRLVRTRAPCGRGKPVTHDEPVFR